MKRILTLSALMLAFTFAPAYAKISNTSLSATSPVAITEVNVDQSRLVRIVGVVNHNIIEKANELIKLASESKKPIYLLINSPGGQVIAGNFFLDALRQVQAQGIKVIGISTVFAASMAFSILLECDERYTLSNTMLLFHPVRVMTRQPLTAPILRELAADLQKFDDKLIPLLVAKLNLKRDVIEKHYYAETFWNAGDLAKASPKFLTVVKSVLNIENMFQYRNQPSFGNQKQLPFYGPQLKEFIRSINTLFVTIKKK